MEGLTISQAANVTALRVPTQSRGSRIFFADLPLLSCRPSQKIAKLAINHLNFIIYAGRIIDRDSILDLIQEYTDYCGRMKPLPDWVMQGAIACIQGGSNKVQRILEQLIRHETPLAAVWLPDWSGQRQQQITSKVA